MQDYPLTQVVIFQAMTFFQTLYIIHFRPSEDKFNNNQEIFNELTIMIHGILLFTFTDLNPTEYGKQMCAYAFICIFSANLIINAVIVSIKML